MKKKERWGSKLGLILAMAGSAVGFGNFLRFPVQAAQNGGGAFLIPYLVCFVLIGLPLLLMEWSMGRLGGASGNHNISFIMHKLGKGGRLWKYVGALSWFSSMSIIAYYCYLESWTISYILHFAFGTFSGMSQLQVAQFFEDYVDIHSHSLIPYENILFFIICILINVYILLKGIGGIEKVAKVGMPLLILFGIGLAVTGWTLGTSGATPEQPDASAWEGFNFLWTPKFDTIWNPKVWLAAAGQIFFTLSMGNGIIQCYASYIKQDQDIALGAISAGFINEFVEVILASAIVIPISAGYLGIDWVKENAGFGMGFQTMPYLFEQWGGVLALIGGLLWFGLLFLAGITSCLAFGASWMSFLQNEFQWSKKNSAWSFGAFILIFGLPTVLFYKQGVFDEYDYWGGTFTVVLFACLEVIAFVWVFGMEKGWKEINKGAHIKLSPLLKYIGKYITPYLLIIMLLGVFFTPLDNDWTGNFKRLFSGEGWLLDNSSVIKQFTQFSLRDELAHTTEPIKIKILQEKLFYGNLARGFLLTLLILLMMMVHRAAIKRKRKGIL